MNKWSVGRYKIETKTGDPVEVTGIVALDQNIGIHTDPVSQQLNITILTGPHAGLRYGPSFGDLGEAVSFADGIADD